ncbi:hypothetical protein SVAN01_08105 [Stagonosporopsis vannaccii]|nr:hypothetical protein SVAN01_08105 [Stagonosporopsis vannaccii]
MQIATISLPFEAASLDHSVLVVDLTALAADVESGGAYWCNHRRRQRPVHRTASISWLASHCVAQSSLPHDGPWRTLGADPSRTDDQSSSEPPSR